MDIDDILRGAETRDSDDHPQTIGEELLSQFKVKELVCTPWVSWNFLGVYSVQVWQLLSGMVSILNFHIQDKFAEVPFYFAETVSQMSPEFCSVSFMPSSINIMKCSLALFINCTITFGKKYEQKRAWRVFQTPLLKETRTVTLLKPDLQKRSQYEIIFEVCSNVHFWTWMIPW